jgi:hypothetical protein
MENERGSYQPSLCASVFFAGRDTPRLYGRQDARRYVKDAMIKRTATFLLKQSLPSDMITALAMERKFQLNQPSQTLGHSRLDQEETRHLFHQILAARGTDAGGGRRQTRGISA